MNTNDRRFVDARDVLDGMSSEQNLATMDWEDFEHLCRQLFEQEFASDGAEVKITQASRDAGVDAVIFNPDPVRGGKIVIQAKRYAGTVDVSAVRDLYGTVHNEGAMKGILVTTSTFGADAYNFIANKPLTLINGGQLLQLLEGHGYKFRIDLAEAKKAAKEKWSPKRERADER
jgi:restriction system protein